MSHVQATGSQNSICFERKEDNVSKRTVQMDLREQCSEDAMLCYAAMPHSESRPCPFFIFMNQHNNYNQALRPLPPGMMEVSVNEM